MINAPQKAWNLEGNWLLEKGNKTKEMGGERAWLGLLQFVVTRRERIGVRNYTHTLPHDCSQAFNLLSILLMLKVHHDHLEQGKDNLLLEFCFSTITGVGKSGLLSHPREGPKGSTPFMMSWWSCGQPVNVLSQLAFTCLSSELLAAKTGWASFQLLFNYLANRIFEVSEPSQMFFGSPHYCSTSQLRSGMRGCAEAQDPMQPHWLHWFDASWMRRCSLSWIEAGDCF